MEPLQLKIRVGDRVIISRPNLSDRFAPRIERVATVTGVRAKSFDAGGLCFRYDGREWSGHNRLRLIPREEDKNEALLVAAAREAEIIERTQRAREDVILAFVLSCRPQEDWLKLGLDELKRIAALHGITSPKTEVLKAPPHRLSALLSLES